MIRVIFLKKEISKNFKIARGNLQLISHPRKSVSGTTVILGSKYPKLHYALIQTAALRGYTEIVKLLAPLCQDPNLSKNGFPTPMSLANINGHEDIISILKPFTM